MYRKMVQKKQVEPPPKKLKRLKPKLVEARPVPALTGPTKKAVYWTVELPALSWIVGRSVTPWDTKDGAYSFAKGRVRAERRVANIWNPQGHFVESLRPAKPITSEMLYRVSRTIEGREYCTFFLSEEHAMSFAEERMKQSGVKHTVMVPGKIVVATFAPKRKLATKPIPRQSAVAPQRRLRHIK